MLPSLLTLAFIRPPQGMEWIIILVIALLIFGKRLPEMARGLGKGIVEFKKGLKGVKEDLDDVDDEIATQERSRLEPPNAANQAKLSEKSATPISERADHPV
jgi:sec-independent protein translocase protein TatA